MRTHLRVPTLLLSSVVIATTATVLLLHNPAQSRSLKALAIPAHTATSPQSDPPARARESSDGESAPHGRPEIDVITHEDREPLQLPAFKRPLDEPIVGC